MCLPRAIGTKVRMPPVNCVVMKMRFHEALGITCRSFILLWKREQESGLRDSNRALALHRSKTVLLTMVNGWKVSQAGRVAGNPATVTSMRASSNLEGTCRPIIRGTSSTPVGA
jgi:hypothetical protein